VRKLSDVEVDQLPGVAVLECELNKPDVPVQWFRDNKPLAPSNKYKMLDDGPVHKLTITDVDGEDEGVYSVVASGKKSEATVFVEGRSSLYFSKHSVARKEIWLILLYLQCNEIHNALISYRN